MSMYYFCPPPHIYLFLSTYEDVTLKIISKVLSRTLTISHLISFLSSACSFPCNAVAFSLLDHANPFSMSQSSRLLFSLPPGACLGSFSTSIRSCSNVMTSETPSRKSPPLNLLYMSSQHLPTHYSMSVYYLPIYHLSPSISITSLKRVSKIVSDTRQELNIC